MFMLHLIDRILDYFLEDILDLLKFMPPIPEKKKSKGKRPIEDDDDLGEDVEVSRYTMFGWRREFRYFQNARSIFKVS